MKRRRHRLARYNHPNPTTGDYVAVGIGALTLIGLGYWVYSRSQANTGLIGPVAGVNSSPNGSGPNPSTMSSASSGYGEWTNSTVQIPPPKAAGT